MRVKFSIARLEKAISKARHQDPAYEPGRSTSRVKDVVLDVATAQVTKNALCESSPASAPPPRKEGWDHSDQVLVYYRRILKPGLLTAGVWPLPKIEVPVAMPYEQD